MRAGKVLSLPEREVHRTRAARMEKAVRTHVGTFKHTDGVHKLQAEFSRNFQAFMEGAPPRHPPASCADCTMPELRVVSHDQPMLTLCRAPLARTRHHACS